MNINNIHLYASMLRMIRKWCEENSYLEVRVPSIHAGYAIHHSEYSVLHNNEQARLIGGNALMVNALALKVGKCYCINRMFRREKNYDFRHLAEYDLFEICHKNLTLSRGIDLCHAIIIEVVESLLDSKYKLYIAPRVLEDVAKPFRRVTYSEIHCPVDKNDANQTSDWELAIAELGPVFVTHYPKYLSSWSSDLLPSGFTASFNLLLPGIGEIADGSQRTHNLNRFRDMNSIMVQNRLQWYINEISANTFPTVGFGLGLERLAMWLFGWQDVRDAQTWFRDTSYSELMKIGD